MDKAEFWTTKRREPEYMTIQFDHASFSAPVYLVANEWGVITLGGIDYTGCPMKITPPDQAKDPIASMTIAFPRPIVGREFLQRIEAMTEATIMQPITVTFRHWITGAALPVTEFVLFASPENGIAFQAGMVQVTATDENPMRADVSIVYDVDIWTGLQSL
jgi:hypothetical protein